MSDARRELFRLEAPFGILGAGLLASSALFSRTGIPEWIPPATTVRLGIPSPLSGMTRSFVSMAGGRPGEAFGWHPLGPVCFLACIAAIPIAVSSVARGRRLDLLSRILGRRPVWFFVGVAFAAVWVRQIVEVTV